MGKEGREKKKKSSSSSSSSNHHSPKSTRQGTSSKTTEKHSTNKSVTSPQTTSEKRKVETNDLGENVKVYLRLRPMDKLETAKRSKDCIELHENPKLITVDSPLLGSFDYTFDQVFDEYTPQIEVYKESLSSIPKQLLNGINCAVMAYGQTGSGKTHTMLGEGMGVELNVRALGLEEDEYTSSTANTNSISINRNTSTEQVSGDPRRNPEVTEGMIPRIIADLLERLNDTPEYLEYTIRCSFVEIYLEKVCDLLQPWREDVRIGKDNVNDPTSTAILGACEVCCLDVADIYAALARANAYRTKASTEQNMDSSRSHLVFTLRLQKIDRDTGRLTNSRLVLIDPAGSEIGKTAAMTCASPTSPAANGKESATTLEGKMINASLASVSNTIRARLFEQGNVEIAYNTNTAISKLAQLLHPCFGGNWMTAIICTGSPSSLNINETINTIKFGQQARQVKNYPKAFHSWTVPICHARVNEAEKRIENMTKLVKMLAHECKHVKGRSKGKDSGNAPLWEVISKVVSSTIPSDTKDVSVKIGGTEEKAAEDRIQELESLLEEHRLAREKAESGMRDMKSEITSLRRQKESIANEKQRMSRELSSTKEELKIMNQRNLELDNLLQTSQFREKEAILFLRQFRTFYFRLLRSKATQGNGTTKDITADISLRIPGVSDLADLLDVDKIMLESGLIEKSEVGTDTNATDYDPSDTALANSKDQAKDASEKESQLIAEQFNSEGELSFGQLASYRQRLLESPAGKLAMRKEQELERDLVEMGKKIVMLQNALVAEKAMVEALSARQGAMGKMKAAQELTTIKQEMERKSNDLHAIVWKMNELHLVNKTLDTKVDSREQHVNYLEEHLVDLQTRNRHLVLDVQDTQHRLEEENTILQDQLDGMATQIWQLGDSDALPLWRMIVPYTGEQIDLGEIDDEEQERFSLGNLEEEDIEDLIHISDRGSSKAEI